MYVCMYVCICYESFMKIYILIQNTKYEYTQRARDHAISVYMPKKKCHIRSVMRKYFTKKWGCYWVLLVLG